jgi:PPOX class probable F420-dependent enzyme
MPSVTAEPADGVLDDGLVRWLSDRHQAVLVTLRADGSPQSSNVAVVFRGSTGYVSVTATRAKTRNLRRDPRAVLHVLGGSFGQYAALAVRAHLGPASTRPSDAAGQDLLGLYETITGQPHPNREEFYHAMVAERRLLLT